MQIFYSQNLYIYIYEKTKDANFPTRRILDFGIILVSIFIFSDIYRRQWIL